MLADKGKEFGFFKLYFTCSTFAKMAFTSIKIVTLTYLRGRDKSNFLDLHMFVLVQLLHTGITFRQDFEILSS